MTKYLNFKREYVDDSFEIVPHNAALVDYGICDMVTHDVPCPVCFDEKAMFVMNDSAFQPCKSCQAKGWKITKPWWIRLKEYFGLSRK